ncbi:MAG: hypothetical protein U9N06_00360 [candidate division WOR-3 bacterium]|nr:hypothetical protein [candidate division WOR-3 bacterium]
MNRRNFIFALIGIMLTIKTGITSLFKMGTIIPESSIKMDEKLLG